MLKNKRLLIGILIILLLILMPVMVNAAEVNATETTKTSTGVNVEWSYTLEGSNIKNLKCTNVSAITGELTIPNTIDEHTVTSIGSNAFENASGLRKVIIPDSVTNIGKSAFSACSGLTNITIPNSVTSIENYAFNKCSGLKSIILSSSITKLNNNVFNDCSGITEIVLPENLTTIGDGGYNWYSPFDGCTGLKYIKIPENVVSIAKDIFYDCSNITVYGKEGSTAQTYAENNKIKFEKIENWDKRNQNSGADITAPTVSTMKLKYSNVMGYYNSTTKDYRLPRGVEIAIIVEFNEEIKGTQIPILTIKCGEGNNIELKNGVISGKNIVYTHKIQENDEGLITAVKLEGGNVSDNSGNKAVLTVKELKVEYNNGYAYANGAKTTSENDNKNPDNVDSNKTPSGNNKPDNEKEETPKKDTTTSTVKLPNTGKVILIWTIAIVAVSGVVAHIRYKKLYIK